MMEFHEEFKKVLDRIDELSILLNTLNRIIGQEDYQTAYQIARQISIKATGIMDCFSNINFIKMEAERK